MLVFIGLTPIWFSIESHNNIPSLSLYSLNGQTIELGDSGGEVWLDGRKEQIMNSNHEWQKHQANERVQARLRDAELHRLSKQGEPKQQQLVPNQKHYQRVIQFVQAKRQVVVARLSELLW